MQGVNFAIKPHPVFHPVFKTHEWYLVCLPTLMQALFQLFFIVFLLVLPLSLCLLLGFHRLVMSFSSFTQLCLGDLTAGGRGCFVLPPTQ